MRVTIIGGGFAGLAAATRLADEGHQVVVVERRAWLGGRAFTDDEQDCGPQPHLGWYRSARDFLVRIGTADALDQGERLQLSFVDVEGGERREVALQSTTRVPALLRGVTALAGFGALSLLDRGLALRVLAAVDARSPSRLAPRPEVGETADAWLGRLGQSQRARRALWHPLLRLSMHDDPRTASALMLAAALRELLAADETASRVALPSLGAAELWREPARRFLGDHRAEVRLSTAATRVRMKIIKDRIILDGVELSGGEVLTSDAVIAAVPPTAALALIPVEIRRAEHYFDNIGRLVAAPLVAVRLELQRSVPGPSLLHLLGSPFHWLLRRGDSVWLRAAATLDGDDDTLGRLAARQLTLVLPGATARSGSTRVLRQPEGALAHTPGGENHRPGPRTPCEGLFFAGDWIRTGLPASLETAARSAHDAATLALEFEPPPPPAPPAGFVPVSNLLRRPTAR